MDIKIEKMNPDVKAKWVEALRSDKYVQVKDKLFEGRNGVVRCCALGVLNDISGLGDWDSDDMYRVSFDDLTDDELESYFLVDLWAEWVYEKSDEIDAVRRFFEGPLSGRLPYDEYPEVRPPSVTEFRDSPVEVQELANDSLTGEETFAHAAVARWAGLKEKDPVVLLDGKPMRIHELNDSHHTFEEIADLIEEQL